MSTPTFPEWRRDNSGTLADYESEVRRRRVRPSTGAVPSFQMRNRNGTYSVYLVRVDGHDIPDGEQLAVFRSKGLTVAQAVNDALNGGLLASIGGATRAERERRLEESR